MKLVRSGEYKICTSPLQQREERVDWEKRRGPLGAPGAVHKVACLVLLVGQILACFDFQATHANAAALQESSVRTPEVQKRTQLCTEH